MTEPYTWQVSYHDAVHETDPGHFAERIYEAISAIEHRLLSPITLNGAEAIALRSARKRLARLQTERLRSPN